MGGARPALRASMVVVLVLKDLAKTTSSMPVVNKVLGIETVPASALPNAAIAATGICASALYGSAQVPLGTQRYHPLVVSE